MSYAVQNGQFVWVGPGPEPIIGETQPAYEARTAGIPVVPTVSTLTNGVVAPAVLPPSDVQPGAIVGVGWWESLIIGGAGLLFGWLAGLMGGDGNGNGNGGAVVPYTPPSGVGQLAGGPGPRGEAYLEFGGIGNRNGEGIVSAGRTTAGTGIIAAGTFRAWDPLQQRYYQLEGNNPYSDISFMPGKAAPDGGTIVKSWVTHAWRKDNSLASTQFARLANGRVMSLSEDGILKSWRPTKHIVLPRGKTTLSQAVKAQTYLDKMWRKVARKTKQLKLA